MITNHSWESEFAKGKAMELLDSWHNNGQDDYCECTGDIDAIDGVCDFCGYKAVHDDEEGEYTIDFKGDKNHEAWAVIDPAGEEVEPSYWYDSREEAMKAAQERNQA